MKRLLAILLLVVSLSMFSQTINVTTNQQTVPQLVNNILINSPCVSAQNVTWRTGTNFGSVNGIGYFTNTNPNFPMNAGVILSTGAAANSSGPNNTELSDGNEAWIGDADLETTLAAAGIIMNSTNATVLEFDFTSISTQFNFDFVFASEEYGNFQCQFSDAFAFLLTNVNTGVTTNLAVVPNTDLPISVVTIRDFLYNSSCSSENEEYFGIFNGGAGIADSATDFNGHTKLLTASAILIPNTPYHIKLVIADREDYESDSAIFIASDSFNVGQFVLGPDLTIIENTALCDAETRLLNSTLNPTEYSFIWKKDGVVLAGENSATLLVTSAGTYTITYTKLLDGCLAETDSILVEFYPPFEFPTPKNLSRCNSGATTQDFDLFQNNLVVAEGLPEGTPISYHSSLSDAQNNINSLPQIYSSAGNETIYVRVENPGGCPGIKPFLLSFVPPPTAYTAPDLKKCEKSSTQHYANFNLNDNKAAILNGQSEDDYLVTYHTSAADANSGADPLAQIFTSGNRTIFVRVQNISDPLCFSTSTFELVLSETPAVDSLPSVIVCAEFILPPLQNGTYYTEANGTGIILLPGTNITETQTVYIYSEILSSDGCAAQRSFKITVIDPVALTPPDSSHCDSYTLPTLEYGEFYSQPNGLGMLLEQQSTITTSQTIYVYYQTTESPTCEINTSFNITISPSPSLDSIQDVLDCESYTLPPLAQGNYYTEANGGGTEIAVGTVITATQDVFVYAVSADPLSCVSAKKFTVYIGNLQPADINQCEPYQLPQLPIGQYYTGPNGTGQEIMAGTIISSSQTIYIYVGNNSQPCASNVQFSLTISQPQIDFFDDLIACGGYELPALIGGNYFTAPNGGGTLLNAGYVVETSKTIYIYAYFSAECKNESSFNITVNAPALIDSRADIDICDSYTLTPLTNGNYYTGPGGTGEILLGGTTLYESQIIYVYNATAATPPCTAEASFELFIFATEADNIGDIVACDQFILPELSNGNYYLNAGGPNENSGIINAGEIITESTILYIYVESGERIVCSDENIVNITINITPDVLPIANVETCDSYTLPNLAIGNYFSASNGGGTELLAGDILTSSQTVYVYAETGTTPNCFEEESFMVKIYNVSELVDLTTCDDYKLPALSVGNYYTEAGGNGTQIPDGTVITESGTYFIYGVSPFSNSCTDESSFTLTIVPSPEAFPVPTPMTTICDDDGINDGIFNFDLSSLATTILGGQISAEFNVTFHESLFEASQNTNPVTSSTNPTIYARVNNDLAPNCFATVKISIFVKKLPEPTFKDAYICIDSKTQTLLSSTTLYSGLNSATHTFLWADSVGHEVGNQANYTAILPGTYTLTSTNMVTGCSSIRTVNLLPSEPATITFTTSEDFANQPYVTITAAGMGGNYVYQIDNGAFQSSPTFYNLSSGIHIITVKDLNGCGNATTSILILNYPHYFTPNGDGANETWNIPDLRSSKNVTITIYDRYGKLISRISPNGAGWDGLYNGSMLPSSDYWFTVKYEVDNEQREFRSHFSLKR